MSKVFSRRRFISISASTLAAGFVPGSLMAQPSPVRWRGDAMGAKAELIIDHPDRKKAESVVQAVQEEIRRLEKIFSLFDQRSELSRLNRIGSLDVPPFDLITCLGDAAQISKITNGAFDVTVQPLWSMYARHFAAETANPEGPDLTEIETAKGLIDYKAIQFDPQRVSFAKPGMAITLNGIAQGYITDRVAELLTARGFKNILIDLGEVRGMGRRQDGSDWQVGIKSPDGFNRLIGKIPLRDRAIATSGGYGTPFTSDGGHHHLFNPKTGQSANMWSSLSVIASDATRADALSTAFSSLPEYSIRQIAEAQKVSVIARDRAGRVWSTYRAGEQFPIPKPKA